MSSTTQGGRSRKDIMNNTFGESTPGLIAEDKDPFERLKSTRLTKYQWRQMNPLRLHNELREVWALVTKHPGCTLRFIANELDITLSRSKRLVDRLIQGGTLIRNAGKFGTLQAPIPLIYLLEKVEGN